MISNKISDEIFVCRDLSLIIDISSLIKYINKNYNEKDLENCSIDKILEFSIKSDSIDNEYLINLTDTLRDEPIIIFLYNNRSFIIDGNHRLLKQKLDGFFHSKVLYLEKEVVSKFAEKIF